MEDCPWQYHTCACDTCHQVGEQHLALLGLYASLEAGGDAWTLLREAAEKVNEALIALHKQHRPQFYDGTVPPWTSDNNLIERRESQDTSDAYAFELDSNGYDKERHLYPFARVTTDNKFMVCEHCRGHALPCDEAPVCDQCILSSTPCVKRLCRLSPDSKVECPRLSCRYAHRDHLPVPKEIDAVEDYIILPGQLRDYLHDGRVPALSWDADAIFGVGVPHLVKERQKQARADFDRWVSEGQGTLASLHYPCGDRCGKRLGVLDAEDGDEEDDGGKRAYSGRRRDFRSFATRRREETTSYYDDESQASDEYSSEQEGDSDSAEGEEYLPD